MRGAWTVLASRENAEGNRCVDIFRRDDGSFGFEEYRRDPEDRGGGGRQRRLDAALAGCRQGPRQGRPRQLFCRTESTPRNLDTPHLAAYGSRRFGAPGVWGGLVVGDAT